VRVLLNTVQYSLVIIDIDIWPKLNRAYCDSGRYSSLRDYNILMRRLPCLLWLRSYPRWRRLPVVAFRIQCETNSRTSCSWIQFRRWGASHRAPGSRQVRLRRCNCDNLDSPCSVVRGNRVRGEDLRRPIRGVQM